MSIQELLPAVQTLTEEDKRRLRDWLEKELSKSAFSAEAILPPGTYSLQSPEPSYEAAEQLMHFLTDERRKRTASFFTEFDICFFQSQSLVEITKRP